MRVKICNKVYEITKFDVHHEMNHKRIGRNLVSMPKTIKLTLHLLNVPEKKEEFLRKIQIHGKFCNVDIMAHRYCKCRINKIEKEYFKNKKLIVTLNALRLEPSPEAECPECEEYELFGEWKKEGNLMYLKCNNCDYAIYEWVD